VALPTPLETLLRSFPAAPDRARLWCDEGDREQTPFLGSWLERNISAQQELRLLIGPEGGWSENERSGLMREPNGIHRVSLGPLVLRAETAAIFSASLITAAFRGRMLKA
jgi:16S rRNA (uracil1498-N3)-methyltransferase